ncbi:MAG: hypothetical protein ABI906_10070, partial [Pseudomonadota bacterium]
MFTLTANAEGRPPPRAPDLGDEVAGSYFGEVTSDSKGSSQSDVAVTITRVAKNSVRIESDYKRLPTVTVPLSRAMDKIIAASGNTTFYYDTARSPPHLDVTFESEVAWSGER